MDDPLSAVDMFTAKNLVEALQGDLLRGRTVVSVYNPSPQAIKRRKIN
jgi:hypothetical protein